MKKIPTLFERDWNGDRSRVLPGEPTVDLTGAHPYRKLDGACCMVRNSILYKRYDAKAGRTPPEGFELVESDETTGHRVGWVRVGDGPEDQWFREARDAADSLDDGTYELIGPKVQGNPERMVTHGLLSHGSIPLDNVPTDFDGLARYLAENRIEGVVWWRDGEPIAKIKRRDFGLSWPVAAP